MVILRILEALLVLSVAAVVSLIAATVLLCTSVLLLVMLWISLDAHRLTPPYWTFLGVLQGVTTLLVLLPHIRR
jgi:hypothetical protein